MMQPPRVSVCIVTYNHGRYIHDCIMSVVAQAEDVALEILVGDDQSSDDTEQIVRKLLLRFPNIIRYFRHERNLGPAGNYQYLIRQAQGEYIAHLDGDDYWLPGKLEAQLNQLAENPQCVASYTNALCVDDAMRLLAVFNNAQPELFDLTYLLRWGNFLNHSSLLYRAQYKSEILSWQSDFIDYQIHIYLASRGMLGYINAVGIGYRVGSHTSMIVHQGERVRSLYWQAVNTDEVRKASRVAFLHVSASFLHRVLIRAIRLRSIEFFMEWWRVVSAAHEGGKEKLATVMLWKLIVTASREAKWAILARLAGVRVRVYYWR